MTPSELFNWALAIALGWGVIVFFMPIDKWLGAFFSRRQTRIKHLEERIAAVERRVAEKPEGASPTDQSD
ncbi:MAG: hypothetical protein K1X78_17770 [Verrucomicrobiaceae bacterium]|nr:hypothetical protein [Verrucomicrobiaceae bacterium]